MQVTKEELNPCTVKLVVVCEPAEVKQGYDKAYKQIAKTLKLPGFRPGHAPRAMIEKVVQKSELDEQAAENIVRDTFKSAIDKESLQPDPTTRPAVEVTALSQDEGKLEYTAKVPLPPKVELGELKGLEVERPPLDVTDDEVDKQLEQIRKRQQTREAVTGRGLEDGDVAVVNIRPDGEAGEGRNFMIIGGQSFKALDTALKGMAVEEIKSKQIQFPEDFQEKDWAGKKLKVQITMNSLNAVKLPELDDAFAKSLNAESVDQLKNRMREAIGQAKLQMTSEMLHEQLLEKLLERSSVCASENMWEALAERRLSEVAQEQAKAGKSLEAYAQENGMTLEQLVQAWRDKSKMHVERALLIREVFAKEQMSLTNDELNKELYAMAAEYGTGPEEMYNLLKANNAFDELNFRAISKKVGEFLLAQAEVREAQPQSAGAGTDPS